MGPARYLFQSGMMIALCASAQAQLPADIAHWSAKAVALERAHSVTLQLNIEHGWHVYSITQAPGGPTRTEITVPAGGPFQLSGEVRGPKPTTAFDPNFQMNTEFYVGSAEFQVPIAKAGAVTSAGGTIDVRFQVCNERLCLPPTRGHVPVALIGSDAVKRGR